MLASLSRQRPQIGPARAGPVRSRQGSHTCFCLTGEPTGDTMRDSDASLRPPRQGGKPVVVFVTGGMWIIGYRAWGAPPTRPPARPGAARMAQPPLILKRASLSNPCVRRRGSAGEAPVRAGDHRRCAGLPEFPTGEEPGVGLPHCCRPPAAGRRRPPRTPCERDVRPSRLLRASKPRRSATTFPAGHRERYDARRVDRDLPCHAQLRAVGGRPEAVRAALRHSSAAYGGSPPCACAVLAVCGIRWRRGGCCAGTFQGSPQLAAVG